MAAKIDQPIYLITDGGALRLEKRLIAAVERALKGGQGNVGWVQLREQKLNSPASDKEVIQLGRELLPICNAYRSRLVINRNIDVARSIWLQAATDLPISVAVHVGADGPDPLTVRKALGESTAVGYSSHSVEESERVQRNVSYLLLGPVFPPLSKTYDGETLGLDALREAASRVNIPLYALGGITSKHAASCRLAGASGVAVITSILSASNPEIAAKKLVEAWAVSPAETLENSPD